MFSISFRKQHDKKKENNLLTLVIKCKFSLLTSSLRQQRVLVLCLHRVIQTRFLARMLSKDCFLISCKLKCKTKQPRWISDVLVSLLPLMANIFVMFLPYYHFFPDILAIWFMITPSRHKIHQNMAVHMAQPVDFVGDIREFQISEKLLSLQ